eukprot:403369315
MKNCLRRYTGFRKHFEFDNKRVLLANKIKVSIVNILQSAVPKKREKRFDKRSSLITSNSAVFCCLQMDDEFEKSPQIKQKGSNHKNSRPINSQKRQSLIFNTGQQKSKISNQNQATQHFSQLICEWTIPYSETKEEIIHASFLEDINSDYLVVVTKDCDLVKSKIYILRVQENNTSNFKENTNLSQYDQSLQMSGKSTQSKFDFKNEELINNYGRHSYHLNNQSSVHQEYQQDYLRNSIKDTIFEQNLQDDQEIQLNPINELELKQAFMDQIRLKSSKFNLKKMNNDENYRIGYHRVGELQQI